MNERIAWIVGIVAAVVIGGGLYLARNRLGGADEQAAPPPETAAPAEPEIKHPVPEAEPSAEPPPPLPPLGESDPPAREALDGVVGAEAVAQWVVPDGIVRRFVATVDNLPRKKVATTVRPLKAVPGKFAVEGSEDELTIDEQNYARYAPLMRLIEAADTGQLAATYLRFYPLMQESYEGLGYPSRYFNDRMIEVIDHLLEAPQVQGPIRLTQPHVMYEFADPKLEALSAGQKALLRIGPANARIVKAKLRALRSEIARSGGKPGAANPGATPPSGATPPGEGEAKPEPGQSGES